MRTARPCEAECRSCSPGSATTRRTRASRRTASARREWTVVATSASSVTLAVRDDEQTRALWPHEFSAELEVTLRDTLQVAMRVHNPSAETITFEQALHTYFAVGDIQTASVHGLEDVPCTEHARAPETTWDHAAPLRFRAETDRVLGRRRDHAASAGAGSRDALTRPQRTRRSWNPWPVKTATLSQMASDDWRVSLRRAASAKERGDARAAAPPAALTLRRARAAECASPLTK